MHVHEQMCTPHVELSVSMRPFYLLHELRKVINKCSVHGPPSVQHCGATDIVVVTLSSTAVERAIARCTSRWAMARGHRLNTSIVLAAVHGLSGLFRAAVSAVEPFTLSPPSHSVPVPNRPTRLCRRKATLNHLQPL